MTRLLDVLRESATLYLSQSGIKGFNFLSSARSRAEQIVWAIALFSATVITMRDVMNSIDAYQSGATLTTLRMKTQLPVQLDHLKICLVWTVENLKTVDKPNWEVLIRLITTLSESTFENLTRLEQDLIELNLYFMDPNNILTALVDLITHFEMYGGNRQFKNKVDTANQLFLKLFPQATGNLASGSTQKF